MEQESGPPLTDDIAALPSVESVTAAIFFFGGLIPLGAEDPVEAITFVGDPRAMGTDVLDGRLPAEDAPDEFVATRLWTEVAGAEIGDRFQLVTITEAAAPTVLAGFGLLAVVADLVAQVMVRRYRTGVARRLAAE